MNCKKFLLGMLFLVFFLNFINFNLNAKSESALTSQFVLESISTQMQALDKNITVKDPIKITDVLQKLDELHKDCPKRKIRKKIRELRKAFLLFRANHGGDNILTVTSESFVELISYLKHYNYLQNNELGFIRKNIGKSYGFIKKRVDKWFTLAIDVLFLLTLSGGGYAIITGRIKDFTVPTEIVCNFIVGLYGIVTSKPLTFVLKHKRLMESILSFAASLKVAGWLLPLI